MVRLFGHYVSPALLGLLGVESLLSFGSFVVGPLLLETRIDELPQLVNVLRGEMSLVGPRPEQPQYVAQLRAAIPFYELRHLGQPGLTGWAQICYPYADFEESWREKLQYDLYYLKNASLGFDLLILLQTVHASCGAAGRGREGRAEVRRKPR